VDKVRNFGLKRCKNGSVVRGVVWVEWWVGGFLVWVEWWVGGYLM